MKDPVFFRQRNPDIPTHLWSSARWESRTKWGYWVMFVLIEFGIAYLSDFVWSMGAHLLACIMFTAVSLGFVTWHYFWWLHERPLKSMHRLFDRNIGGHLVSLYIPNELAPSEEQRGRIWRSIRVSLTGLSEAATNYCDALSESPEELTPDNQVLKSLAVVETVLRQEDTIRALTSSGTSDDEDKAIDGLNNLIDDAKDLIMKETRRVREMFGKGAAAGIERAIDFAVNGPSDKGASTTKTGTLTVGDSQDPATMGADPTDEPSTSSDPDNLTLWGDSNLRVTTDDHTSYVRKKEGI